MNFPLSPDMTHQTETFGPLEVGDTCDISFAEAERLLAEQRTHPVEKDPTGRDPHAKGAKLDAGKCRPGLVLGSFARALWAVSMVGTYGAVKYTEDGWISVPNGQARYDDAMLRHWLKEKTGEAADPDTELSHLAHAAWNALAILDLAIRKQEQVKK